MLFETHALQGKVLIAVNTYLPKFPQNASCFLNILTQKMKVMTITKISKNKRKSRDSKVAGHVLHGLEVVNSESQFGQKLFTIFLITFLFLNILENNPKGGVRGDPWASNYRF